MQDIFYPSKDGKNTVHACLWKPEGEARGVVQIIHGMCEYDTASPSSLRRI